MARAGDRAAPATRSIVGASQSDELQVAALGVSHHHRVVEGLARGVWFYPAGTGHPVSDAVMFGPPFTITEEHVEEMVAVLKEAIDAAKRAL